MNFRNWATAAAATLVLATTLATHAWAGAANVAPDPFEAQVAAAKTAMMGDPQVALAKSLAALKFARGEGHARQSEHIATAQWLQGEALIRLNRLDEAAPVIAQGLATVAKAAPDTKLHGDLVMAEAEIQATQGSVQPAMQNFQAAYRIFGKAAQPRSQAIALQNIGSIYQDAGDYPKVLQYYAQSAELYKDDPVLLMSAHNNVGNALKEQKKYAEAVIEFGEALGYARKMESPLLEASILENLASTEVQAGDIAAAQKNLDEGLRIAQSDTAAAERPYLWGVAAQIAQKRGQYTLAAQDLDRTFAGLDFETTDLTFRDFHRTAYEVHSQLGDEHKALAHLRAYKRLDDAARTVAANTNAALMAARFDFANQASRIAQLKAGQLQRDIALARARNLVTAVMLAGSLIVGGLLLAGFLSIRRSRNEVRAANAKLTRANATLEKALNARAEFLASTSHEIRTPLNGIIGMTQVVLAQPDLAPDLRDKISVVHGAGETMRALVDDLLDIARIESGDVVLHPTEVDLPTLCADIAQVWTERARQKGLSVVVDATGAPACIVADAARLRQILFHLMSNAVKFTHEGGVTLVAKVSDAGDQLLLAVRDSGVGIGPGQLNQVFETFSQADGSITRTYGGAGLGLAICRRLSRAMGGDISVESASGEGSTFTLVVPLTLGAALQSPATGAEAPSTLGDCRLLICDANPLSQAVVKALLQPQLRAVEAVTSCGAASGAAKSGRFDLVLADAATLGPDAESRVSAARELAIAAAPARLAVMIAPEGDEAARLHAAGVAQVIGKPIAASALVAELARGLAERSTQTAPAGAVSAA